MCKTGKIGYNGRNFSVPSNWRKRYKEIWDYFKSKREDYQYYEFMEQVRLNGGKPKYLTPMQVSAIMDNKELIYSLRKAEKRRNFHNSPRRIMSR